MSPVFGPSNHSSPLLAEDPRNVRVEQQRRRIAKARHIYGQAAKLAAVCSNAQFAARG